ncbi:unnamed protein product [Caenorhabditis bovis]|uniref:Caveolin n=1 Tax=Caenorhabditis bovis TaxID=2654633 RepID=A0A8S1EYC8_9PELO|nr:unnamed protein product [Caenorhabditis bovis]
MSNDEQQQNAETKPEEVPLTEPTEAAPEEPKPKKNWFTWGKPKAAADVTDEANVENGDEGKKEKKTCWWKKCSNKGENAQKDENISIGIDLVHRDERQINNHVQFDFGDVYGEADSQHSWDCVWRLNYKVFSWTRLVVYRLLGLIALPFTILFAILFGVVSCFNVFLVLPLVKLLSIPGNGLAKIWHWLIHAVFDPLASSIGLLFSSFTIRKYGINQETTAPCV